MRLLIAILIACALVGCEAIDTTRPIHENLRPIQIQTAPDGHDYLYFPYSAEWSHAVGCRKCALTDTLALQVDTTKAKYMRLVVKFDQDSLKKD